MLYLLEIYIPTCISFLLLQQIFGEPYTDADAWRVSSNKRVESIESITEDSHLKQQLEIPLTCHVCHSEIHAECEYLDDQEYSTDKYAENCPPGFGICQVKRFSYTSTTNDENGTRTDLRVVGLKRFCAEKCEQGCVNMGSQSTKLHVCSSCCSSRLCNVGSSGASGSGLIRGRRTPFWKTPEPWALLIFITLLLFIQTQKIAIFFAKFPNFKESSDIISNQKAI